MSKAMKEQAIKTKEDAHIAAGARKDFAIVGGVTDSTVASFYDVQCLLEGQKEKTMEIRLLPISHPHLLRFSLQARKG